MAADWKIIQTNAIAAAETVLVESWKTSVQGATGSIAALMQTAQYIEANRASMTDKEAQFVMAQQKAAMQSVLTAYASIGLAAAQNAIAAVLDVIIKAVPSLVGFV